MSLQRLRSPAHPLLSFALLLASLPACGDDEASSSGAGGAGGASSVDGATTATATSTSTSTSAATSSSSSTSTGMDWTTVEDLTVVDLGTVDTATTPEITFDIPEKTLGFTLLAEVDEVQRQVGISEMSRVGGANVVENFDLPGRAEPQFLGLQCAVAQNPQTDLPDAMPLATGTWRARLKAEAPVTDVRTRLVVRRTSDGVFHGGVIDVDVRVAPDAATEAYVAEVLAATFGNHLGPQVGLEEGEVTYGDLAAEYGAVDTDLEFREMVRSTASDAFPRWNLYVVNEMPVYPEAYAFAGSLPGSLLPGTSTNAVVWVPTGSVELDAVILAHEYGHLAGLFHVREFAGDNEDVLDDTTFGDTTNIMRPSASTAATVFSPKQITVLQGSAAYRGILEEGGEPRPAQVVDASPLPRWRTAVEIAPRAPRSPLEALLASHWCAHAPGLLEHFGGEARDRGAELVELARDDEAPAFVRLRAAALVERIGDGAQRGRIAELVGAWARDGEQPAPLRGWALRQVANGAADRGGR